MSAGQSGTCSPGYCCCPPLFALAFRAEERGDRPLPPPSPERMPEPKPTEPSPELSESSSSPSSSSLSVSPYLLPSPSSSSSSMAPPAMPPLLRRVGGSDPIASRRVKIRDTTTCARRPATLPREDGVPAAAARRSQSSTIPARKARSRVVRSRALHRSHSSSSASFVSPSTVTPHPAPSLIRSGGAPAVPTRLLPLPLPLLLLSPQLTLLLPLAPSPPSTPPSPAAKRPSFN